MEKLKKIGSVLGRSEMRKIMAGSGSGGCFVECCGCQNDTCRTFITSGSCSNACLQLCGPGHAGGGGACCECDCLA